MELKWLTCQISVPFKLIFFFSRWATFRLSGLSSCPTPLTLVRLHTETYKTSHFGHVIKHGFLLKRAFPFYRRFSVITHRDIFRFSALRQFCLVRWMLLMRQRGCLLCRLELCRPVSFEQHSFQGCWLRCPQPFLTCLAGRPHHQRRGAGNRTKHLNELPNWVLSSTGMDHGGLPEKIIQS